MITNLRCSVSLAALALATGLAASCPASAADLPVKAVRPMVPAAISWQGFYLGGHGGWGGAKHSGSYGDFGELTSGDQLNLEGAFVGLQAGYNWDFGSWIFGVEGDVSFMRWRGNAFSPASSDFATGEINNLASIRARIGIPVSNDRSGFLYVTGGAAWVNANVTVYDGVAGGSTTISQKIDFDKIGGVIGGGFEWAATPQLRLRIEGLYYMFNKGEAVSTLLDGTVPGDHFKLDNIWTVRGGVTWYFNTPAVGKGPLVARY